MQDYPDLTKLRILRYPDPMLHKHAEEIREVNSFLKEMTARMAELMQEEKGIGLAAPQVGWRFRLALVNPTMEPGKFEPFLNPVIIERKGKVLGEEGCLSVPGVFAKVKRAEKVRVRATRLDGETVEFESEGLAARLWQHELDHFEGTLFVERLGPATRILIKDSLSELERRYVEKAASPGESEETK